MAEQSQHIVVSFAQTGPEGDEWLNVELDDEMNGDRTSFSPGENIYIRVMRHPAESYQVYTNGGTATKVGTNVNLAITDEEMTFLQETEKQLNKRPRVGAAVTFQAACGSPGTPAVNGRKVSFATEKTAAFRVSYEVLFDRWRLNFPCTTGPALFVVVMGEQKQSLSISIEEGIGPREYTLIVKDYCTDAIIPAATVFLDGVEIGDTDTSGRIDLGELNPGQTYQIKIVKTGYLDSDIDVIRNDEFTVPTS